MKLKLSLLSLLVTFLLPLHTFAASKYQFNFDVGMDDPQTGDTRTSAATLVRFGLTTSPTTFRLNTGFTYLHSSNLKQGEFSIGPHIYPLARLRAAPAQPFLWAAGAFGVGSFQDKTRMDFGYAIGAGVDIHLFRKSGITLAVELKMATETATRLWVGYFW